MWPLGLPSKICFCVLGVDSYEWNGPVIGVGSQTGREQSIQGCVSLQLFPWSEERSPQKSCYSTVNETKKLGLEEHERGR